MHRTGKRVQTTEEGRNRSDKQPETSWPTPPTMKTEVIKSAPELKDILAYSGYSNNEEIYR